MQTAICHEFSAQLAIAISANSINVVWIVSTIALTIVSQIVTGCYLCCNFVCRDVLTNYLQYRPAEHHCPWADCSNISWRNIRFVKIFYCLCHGRLLFYSVRFAWIIEPHAEYSAIVFVLHNRPTLCSRKTCREKTRQFHKSVVNAAVCILRG